MCGSNTSPPQGPIFRTRPWRRSPLPTFTAPEGGAESSSRRIGTSLDGVGILLREGDIAIRAMSFGAIEPRVGSEEGRARVRAETGIRRTQRAILLSAVWSFEDPVRYKAVCVNSVADSCIPPP